MTFDDMIRAMTPEVHARLKQAVETGRWADGVALSDKQMASSLQAVIAYEAQHAQPSDEPFRITASGELRPATKPQTPRGERLPLHVHGDE